MMLNPLAQIIQDMRHYIVIQAACVVGSYITIIFGGVIPYILPVLILIVGYSIFHNMLRICGDFYNVR